jgi:hypothetical protein
VSVRGRTLKIADPDGVLLEMQQKIDRHKDLLACLGG